MLLIDLLTQKGLIISTSQARRLIFQEAVLVNGNVNHDIFAKVKPGDVVKVGKRLEIIVPTATPEQESQEHGN